MHNIYIQFLITVKSKFTNVCSYFFKTYYLYKFLITVKDKSVKVHSDYLTPTVYRFFGILFIEIKFNVVYHFCC